VCSSDLKNSVAFSAGYQGQAKAGLGSWIVLTERNKAGRNRNDETCVILTVKAAQIDGENLKPNVFYMLKGGEFVESESESE
jgi:hypothetical protein